MEEEGFLPTCPELESLGCHRPNELFWHWTVSPQMQPWQLSLRTWSSRQKCRRPRDAVVHVSRTDWECQGEISWGNCSRNKLKRHESAKPFKRCQHCGCAGVQDVGSHSKAPVVNSSCGTCKGWTFYFTVTTSLSLSLSLSLMGTCNCTVDGGRWLMLTRLRPEPVLVLAVRGLLNRTYSACDTMVTTSLILFTFTHANRWGAAINQFLRLLHVVPANFDTSQPNPCR